jgi:O-methyltransferase
MLLINKRDFLSSIKERVHKLLCIFSHHSEKRPQDRTELGNTTPGDTLRQKLWFASSYEEVKQLLAPFDFIKIYKGWIPDVFGQIQNRDEIFSLVHIDVDLYEPTRESLQFFFPSYGTGGMILIDDYGHAQFAGAKKAVDEFLANKKVMITLENNLSGDLIVV